jgi:hypothetical protein
MSKEIQKGITWLEKEMEKDQKAIEASKMKMIEEIKKLDKSKLFQQEKKQKNKKTFWDKLLIIIGYAKKR